MGDGWITPAGIPPGPGHVLAVSGSRSSRSSSNMAAMIFEINST